jgi:phosphoglycerate dehydrogenase-like enzyme
MVPQEAIDYLFGYGFDVIQVRDNFIDHEKLHAVLKDASAYIVGGYEQPMAEHFNLAKDLEVVAWPGVDYKSNIPGWQRAFELGIAVVNAPGLNTNSVAEFTFALILMMARSIGFFFEKEENGLSFPIGEEIFGKTIGIIGMGRIGTRVAKIAKLGFNMEIVYSSRSRHIEVEQELNAKYLTKNELLTVSDIISLHRPGLLDGELPEIGAYEFSLAKSSAILINSGKYNLVDPEALYYALINRQISAAAFDEVGNNIHWTHICALNKNRFIWFPHIGFYTAKANYETSMLVSRAIVDILSGSSNQYVNNPDFRNIREPHI